MSLYGALRERWTDRSTGPTGPTGLFHPLSDVARETQGESGIRLDGWLLFAWAGILGLGFVIMTSASIALGDKLGNPYYYAIRQGVALGLGLIGAVLVMRVPLRRIQELRWALLALAFALLVLVLVPGIGKQVNGAQRWIPLGIFNLQVAESARLLIIAYVAAYLVARGERVRGSFMGLFIPLLVAGMAAVLMLMQPDFGSSAVLVATVMGMVFLAGANLRWIIVGGALATVAAIMLVYAEPYRVERLLGFKDPWADPFDKGFQLTNALIAIGSGGWTGLGLGSSVQKLFYLPEAHTDFVFAVLAEELGLLGVLSVILLYGVLIWRGFVIGRWALEAGQAFGAYLAWGITLWLGLQAYINMGVNMGALPTKGLTLPLMSYGGSSLMVVCVGLGLLMRVYHEASQPIPGVQRNAT